MMHIANMVFVFGAMVGGIVGYQIGKRWGK